MRRFTIVPENALFLVKLIDQCFHIPLNDEFKIYFVYLLFFIHLFFIEYFDTFINDSIKQFLCLCFALLLKVLCVYTNFPISCQLLNHLLFLLTNCPFIINQLLIILLNCFHVPFLRFSQFAFTIFLPAHYLCF